MECMAQIITFEWQSSISAIELVSQIAVDGLTRQGVRMSATMILIYLSKNLPGSVPENLIYAEHENLLLSLIQDLKNNISWHADQWWFMIITYHEVCDL